MKRAFHLDRLGEEPERLMRAGAPGIVVLRDVLDAAQVSHRLRNLQFCLIELEISKD